MNKSNAVFLHHIQDAISRIEGYTANTDWKSFSNNFLVQDGVIRQLEIIGEAVKSLSKKIRIQNPHIPWEDIAGMRDKLIHHYFGVDIDKVWNTVQDEIPTLKDDIIKILDKIDRSPTNPSSV